MRILYIIFNIGSKNSYIYTLFQEHQIDFEEVSQPAAVVRLLAKQVPLPKHRVTKWNKNRRWTMMPSRLGSLRKKMNQSLFFQFYNINTFKTDRRASKRHSGNSKNKILRSSSKVPTSQKTVRRS